MEKSTRAFCFEIIVGLRQRVHRRLHKRLRALRHREPAFVTGVDRLVRAGKSVELALREMILGSDNFWLLRGSAARVLAIAQRKQVVSELLAQFLSQTEKDELWQTALTIEHFGDSLAVGPLVVALDDSNPHRRHGAARALGWIPNAGPKAAKALRRAIQDKSQPQPVREEAAESLAYLRYSPAVPVLIDVLEEPDVRMRFWAVFALGGLGQWQYYDRGTDPRIIAALERMLSDEAVAPGNWWSVSKEALAMLAPLRGDYSAELAHETRRVLDDPNSSAEDRRWAESYMR